VPLVFLERSWWAGFNGIYLVRFGGFRMWIHSANWRTAVVLHAWYSWHDIVNIILLTHFFHTHRRWDRAGSTIHLKHSQLIYFCTAFFQYHQQQPTIFSSLYLASSLWAVHCSKSSDNCKLGAQVSESLTCEQLTFSVDQIILTGQKIGASSYGSWAFLYVGITQQSWSTGEC